ncbi:MAG: NUDIX hydrolase [Bacilli bacterium]
MEEYVTIFNESYEEIGSATRSEAHQRGLWHEVVHFWVIDDSSMYLQLRSANKKDWPQCFDCTAAGHLLHGEDVKKDGIRELEEELGLNGSHYKIQYCGRIKEETMAGNLIDKEYVHLHLAQLVTLQPQWALQKEEVETIVRLPLAKFLDFWSGNARTVQAECVLTGQKHSVSWENFVPYEADYIRTLTTLLSPFNRKIL